MNNDWKEISISTTTVVGELLSDFLISEGAKGVVLGEWKPDAVSEYTIVKAYFPQEFDNMSELSEKINAKFEHYKDSGLNTGAKEITVNLVKEEDWANSWKQYFHTFKIANHTIIKPIWEEYEKQPNDIVVNFDPGMAFGTGSHPSTQLCMQEIEERFFDSDTNKETYNVFDLGTGSGILAIQFGLLGFKKITAADTDPVSVRASRENFRINNLDINLFEGSISQCTEEFDFIAGNLLAEIIEMLSSDIFAKLKKGGIFMGSGIINHKENDVIEKLTSVGLTLKKQKYQGDWVLLIFEK